MIVFPNAKINLGLRVLGKRRDGFHDLDTIFMPIGLYDIMEIVPAERDVLEVAGLSKDLDGETNIVMQAVHLLRTFYDVPPVKIFLYKQIPVGAGLGGGSSDAAFMLLTMNRLFELGISVDELKKLALQLGSDVPFFIENKILRASGRGEFFHTIDLDIRANWLLVVFPGIFISTRVAFSYLKRYGKPLELPEKIEMTASYLTNDFEHPVFERYPFLADIKKDFLSAGAVFAGMSGTGSSVFGFFIEKPIALLSRNYYFWRLIKL